MESDINISIARLQNEIRKRLDLGQDQVIFDFHPSEKGHKLDLITINPRHDQSFLLHSVEEKDKIIALEAMQAYVTKHIRQESSYTVQWSRIGKSELHTSYFRARDIYEVLEKFSHGRDMNAYSIFSIILNPIA